MKRELLDRVRGCFLAGAMGDALGYPVEFYTLVTIYNQYGKKGITDLEIDKQFKKSIITDDTQMLLFTAEG